ncbi:gamma-glutamyl-gamma-aminobutyrate hydrolase family protein [Natronospora cellulosivora (SeqCode)]
MRRAVIGISANYNSDINAFTLSSYYTKAILKAGGVPVILAVTLNNEIIKEYISMIDGLILSGGGDIDPLIYSEEPIKEMGSISPKRDYFEIELVKQADNAGLSILGICKGCQLINIAMGGSVYQDIYQQNITEIKHIQEAPSWYPTHHINIIEGTYLHKIIKKRRSHVNSIHHQSIKKLASNFKIAARADDGVIEAIEKNADKFVMGLQWHPETMLDSSDSILIFKEFISCALTK